MKTPISYYGGKQSMVRHIIPLIPKQHEIYVEPFFGGGAIFWAKAPSTVEIINDYNALVINFYEQLKLNYAELKQKIEATPYSREVYKYAMFIYHNPYIFNPITKAWAFWEATIQGFGNKIGSWRSSQRNNKEIKTFENKKAQLTTAFAERLKYVQMEQKDAVELILQHDSTETLFYLDPPYVGSNQGHYGGYTQDHFDKLLKVLAIVKGDFILSSYPNESLNKYIKEHNWVYREYDMNLSMSRQSNKRKIECLTMNFHSEKGA